MPRKDKASYQEYMREYMRTKRQGLTGINKRLLVGVRGLEPPTSASQTLRASRLRYTPCIESIAKQLLRVKLETHSGLNLGSQGSYQTHRWVNLLT